MPSKNRSGTRAVFRAVVGSASMTTNCPMARTRSGSESLARGRRICRRHENWDRPGESIPGHIEFAWADGCEDSASLGYRILGGIELVEVVIECRQGARPLWSA